MIFDICPHCRKNYLTNSIEMELHVCMGCIERSLEKKKMIKIYFMKRDETRIIDDLLFDSRKGDKTAFPKIIEKFKSGSCYELVAEVDTEFLETAWAGVQNGVRTNSWGRNPVFGVKPIIGTFMHEGQIIGNRSSMVGDIFVTPDDSAHIVDSFGFAKLEIPEKSSDEFKLAADLKPQNVVFIDGIRCEVLEVFDSLAGLILTVLSENEFEIKVKVIVRNNQVMVLGKNEADAFINAQIKWRGANRKIDENNEG